MTAPNFFELTPAERGRLTGGALQEALTASGRGERAFWREYLVDSGLTYDALHGRLWRARNNMRGHPEYYQWDIGAPLDIQTDGNLVVFNDVHLPLTDHDWIGLMLAVGKKYLKNGRRVFVCAGDLFNGSVFSKHPAVTQEPPWVYEKRAARDFLSELFSVFDYGYWILGNHDQWITRYTSAHITMDDLKDMAGGDDRLIISEFDHLFMTMPNTGRWIATHAQRYSKDPLKSANALATYYQCNVIRPHEHHAGISVNDTGQYMIVDNGGLFRHESMAYVGRRTMGLPKMVRAFTLMRDGFPNLLMPHPFTDWNRWL